VFVDDIIVTCLGKSEYIPAAQAAVPLAVHILARPFSATDKSRRENMLALSKLAAEGGLREEHHILGWLINTRSLLIKLPPDKHTAWSLEINNVIAKQSIKHGELESLLGRLVNVSSIIPLSNFYLGDLRRHIKRYKSKWLMRKLDESECKILSLWLDFLQKAREGINLNILVHRQPTNVIITDACPRGIGGFSLPSGKAWRMYFSPKLVIVNNSIEFLASVVGIWVAINNKDITTLGGILSLCDNKSCVHWLQHSHFNSETHSVNCTISCHLASLTILNNI
jgi:hypothetical protein